ncbi:MAG: formate transporter FocA [Planctomycetales bacterium]|nr:formate transporter FocA [Planctomycetales bacterium]
MSSSNSHFMHIDAFIPAEMAELAEEVGVKKTNLPRGIMFLLAVLAGAFIALGAIFSTTVTAGMAGQLPFGVVKLLGGLTFCLGLILVVVAGAELFTGNNLRVMALASGKITVNQLLVSWIIVFVGNFVGSVATALFILASCQYMHGNGSVGLNALTIATGKCQLAFFQAFTLGILCNALVCLAVWLCYSARSTTDKILSILFPITAFVAAGFEHSVANMYFIPVGIFIKSYAPATFWEAVGKSSLDYGALNWNNFLLGNLLPVTLGNIFGGAAMVGLVYWYIYRRKTA